MQINFGIREKLLTPMVLGLLIIIASIIFILKPEQLAKERVEFIDAQKELIQTLTPSIIQNISANNLAELHSVFENAILIHKDEWRYIELRDLDNKLLYPIVSIIPKLSNTLISIKNTVKENKEVFGYITLYTDWEEKKNKELIKINQLNIFSIFLFCSIALLGFIIQTKWVFQPIVKLKNVTHQFSLGNYDTPLPKTSNDEVGSLTLSIEQMRNKIQSTIEKLTIEEKSQRVILESVPDAIITIDSQGIIKSFNPSAETIFQYDKNQVIGQNIKMLMPPSQAVEHDQYLTDSNISDETKTIGTKRELYGLKQDGREFPLEITLRSLIIEGETIFTGVLRDITERKKVDQLKSEFISTVSHELRTPLTAIKGALDIITHGLNLELPKQATTMLDISNRNVDRLLALINDILDISKLESGELNFSLEKIEIEPFLANCIELNQEYAKIYKTQYTLTHCDKNIFINIDQDRLTQVMSNFLSNAAKYSPQNIDIEIFTSTNQGRLRVNVKDYGQGIPEEFQDAVFEKFTQSSSGNTRQVGGTGLGLSVSKMIIENLGGSIGFDTKENVQTTFYFELPIIKK